MPKKSGKMMFQTDNDPLGQDQFAKHAQNLAQPASMASVGNMYVPSLAAQPQPVPSEAQGFEIGSLPGITRKKNQMYSLEQTRFLNRIKNASRRQNEMYKYQCNQNKAIEKVKYAKMLERAELDAYKTGGHEGETYNFRQPLGKVVTQVEMNNPEARL